MAHRGEPYHYAPETRSLSEHPYRSGTRADESDLYTRERERYTGVSSRPPQSYHVDAPAEQRPARSSQRDPFVRERGPYARKPNPYGTERDSYVRERDPYATERDPYVRERDPYAAERDPLVTERDPYLRERDPVLRERNLPYTDRFPNTREKNPYVAGRDLCSRERDPHVVVYDHYSRERDPYASERDWYSRERDPHVAERDHLVAKRHLYLRESDHLDVERDLYSKQRNPHVAEREQLLTKKDSLIAERDLYVRESTPYIAGRDKNQYAIVSDDYSRQSETSVRDGGHIAIERKQSIEWRNQYRANIEPVSETVLQEDNPDQAEGALVKEFSNDRSQEQFFNRTSLQQSISEQYEEQSHLDDDEEQLTFDDESTLTYDSHPTESVNRMCKGDGYIHEFSGAMQSANRGINAKRKENPAVLSECFDGEYPPVRGRENHLEFETERELTYHSDNADILQGSRGKELLGQYSRTAGMSGHESHRSMGSDRPARETCGSNLQSPFADKHLTDINDPDSGQVLSYMKDNMSVEDSRDSDYELMESQTDKLGCRETDVSTIKTSGKTQAYVKHQHHFLEKGLQHCPVERRTYLLETPPLNTAEFSAENRKYLLETPSVIEADSPAGLVSKTKVVRPCLLPHPTAKSMSSSVHQSLARPSSTSGKAESTAQNRKYLLETPSVSISDFPAESQVPATEVQSSCLLPQSTTCPVSGSVHQSKGLLPTPPHSPLDIVPEPTCLPESLLVKKGSSLAAKLTLSPKDLAIAVSSPTSAINVPFSKASELPTDTVSERAEMLNILNSCMEVDSTSIESPSNKDEMFNLLNQTTLDSPLQTVNKDLKAKQTRMKEQKANYHVQDTKSKIQQEVKAKHMELTASKIKQSLEDLRHESNVQKESLMSPVQSCTKNLGTPDSELPPEIQMLQNIRIQLELTKALENMQKTMQSLQVKIKESQKCPQEVSRSDSIQANVVSSSVDANEDVYDDTAMEISDDIEDGKIEEHAGNLTEKEVEVASEGNEKKESETDQCYTAAVKSTNQTDESENEMKKQDDTTVYKEVKQAGKQEDTKEKEEVKQIEKQEDKKGTEEAKQTKEIVVANQTQPTAKSSYTGEYKTYREWRLAKERMKKYFEEQQNQNTTCKSGDEKPNFEKDPQRINDDKIGSSKTVSDLPAKNNNASGIEQNEQQKDSENKTEYSEKLAPAAPFDSSKDAMSEKYRFDNCHSKTDRLSVSSEGSGSYHSSHRTYASDRKHSDKHRSSQSYDCDHRSSSGRHKEKHKHSHKHDRHDRSDSYTSRDRHYSSSKESSRDASRDRHKSCSKESSRETSRDRHYFSSNESSTNASRDRNYSRSKESSTNASRERHYSSSKESSKNASKERHYSSSKESSANASRERHYSSSKEAYNKPRQEDISGKSPERGSARDVNRHENYDNEEIDVVGLDVKEMKNCQSADESNSTFRHSNENLFEKLEMDSSQQPKDVDFSGYENKDVNETITEKECIDPVLTKKVVVRLVDIGRRVSESNTKSPVTETKNKQLDTGANMKQQVRSQGNIFEKMFQSVSSMQRSMSLPSAKKEPDKKKLSVKNTSLKLSQGKIQASKQISPESDESSSDSEVFTKISNILNSDKRKLKLKVVNSENSPLKVIHLHKKQPDKVNKSSKTDNCDFSDLKTKQSLGISPLNPKNIETVKHLKKVDKNLFWKHYKLKFPHIKLHRLNADKRKKFKCNLISLEFSKTKQNNKARVTEIPSFSKEMHKPEEDHIRVVDNVRMVKPSCVTDAPSTRALKRDSEGQIRANQDMKQDNAFKNDGSKLFIDLPQIKAKETKSIERDSEIEKTENDRELLKDKSNQAIKKSAQVEEHGEIDKNKKNELVTAHKSGSSYRQDEALPYQASLSNLESKLSVNVESDFSIDNKFSDLEEVVNDSQQDETAVFVSEFDTIEELEGSLGSDDLCFNIDSPIQVVGESNFHKSNKVSGEFNWIVSDTDSISESLVTTEMDDTSDALTIKRKSSGLYRRQETTQDEESDWNECKRKDNISVNLKGYNAKMDAESGGSDFECLKERKYKTLDVHISTQSEMDDTSDALTIKQKSSGLSQRQETTQDEESDWNECKAQDNISVNLKGYNAKMDAESKFHKSSKGSGEINWIVSDTDNISESLVTTEMDDTSDALTIKRKSSGLYRRQETTEDEESDWNECKTQDNIPVNLKGYNAKMDAESSGPDFECLKEGKYKTLDVHISTQSDTGVNSQENDCFSNTEAADSQQDKVDIDTEQTLETNFSNTTSCSVAAALSSKGRKNSKSSSSSNEEESFNQSRSSAIKYKRRHSERSSGEKSEKTKADDEGSKNKPASEKDGENHTHRKRLFKSKSKSPLKSQFTIAQMDGNADVLAGPPEESSGDEGDVEDNISFIDLDTESDNDENSASQDLFADVPERLKRMTVNLTQNVAANETSSGAGQETVQSAKTSDEEKPSTSKGTSNENSKKDEFVASKENIDNISESDEVTIKDEPDWLKTGYTQEPDTIFLDSDGDDITISYPPLPILVSDEDEENIDENQQMLSVIKVEKKENVTGTGESAETLCFSDDGFSSAENWSDQGSDFEPDDVFNNTKRNEGNNYKAKLSNSDDSDISDRDSDFEIFKTQNSYQKPKEKFKLNGSDIGSSDETVNSVSENDIFIEGEKKDGQDLDFNEKLVKPVKEEPKNTYKDNESSHGNSEFDSDDDEILCTSAFDIEAKLWRQKLLTKKLARNEVDEDKLENSQSFKSIQVAEKAEYKILPGGSDLEAGPANASSTKANNVSSDSFGKNYQEMSPSSIKIDNDVEEVTKTKAEASFNDNEINEDHSDDDSDIMIIDTYQGISKDKPSPLENPKAGSDKNLIDEEQTLVADNLDGVQQDYLVNTQVTLEVDKAESRYATNTMLVDQEVKKGVETELYSSATQVEEPGPSGVGRKQSREDLREKIHIAKKTIKIPSSSKKTINGKAAVAGSEEIYEAQTQSVFGTSCSSEKKLNDSVTRNVVKSLQQDEDNFSDDDPQKLLYFKQSETQQTVALNRLSQRLGILFEHFSDNSENEQSDCFFEMFTQVDTKKQKKFKRTEHDKSHFGTKTRNSRLTDKSAYVAPTQSSYMSPASKEDELNNSQELDDTLVNTNEADHTKVIDKSPYNDQTVVILSSESQVEQSPVKAHKQGTSKNNGHKKIETNAYFNATQVDDSFDEQDENEFEAMTQVYPVKTNNRQNKYSTMTQKEPQKETTLSRNGVDESLDIQDESRKEDAFIKNRVDESVDKQDKNEFEAMTQVDPVKSNNRQNRYNTMTPKEPRKEAAFIKNRVDESLDEQDENEFEAMTQVYPVKSSSRKNKYYTMTQKEPRKEAAFIKNRVDESLDKEDENEFEAMTQMYPVKTNNRQNTYYTMTQKEPRKETASSKKKEIAPFSDNIFEAMTQIEVQNRNATDDNIDYEVMTQIDKDAGKQNKKFGNSGLEFDDISDENPYENETQVDVLEAEDLTDTEDLPDIEDKTHIKNQSLEDIYNIDMPDMFEEENYDSENRKMPAIEHNITELGNNGSIGEDVRKEKTNRQPVRTNMLKRSVSEISTEKSALQFEENDGGSGPKRIRFNVPEMRILPTEPQRLKTVAEKRASGIVTSFNIPQNKIRPTTSVDSGSEIEIVDSNKWLSKQKDANKIRVSEKSKAGHRDGKRKRRESLSETLLLKARMQAAKSQINERIMHNVAHPEPCKRPKLNNPAPPMASDLEDVTLPSNSQIIREGLPVLNQTGLLVKGGKHSSTSRGPSRAEMLTEAMLNSANKVSVLNSAKITTTFTMTTSSTSNTVLSTTVNNSPIVYPGRSFNKDPHKDERNTKEPSVNHHKDERIVKEPSINHMESRELSGTSIVNGKLDDKRAERTMEHKHKKSSKNHSHRSKDHGTDKNRVEKDSKNHKDSAHSKDNKKKESDRRKLDKDNNKRDQKKEEGKGQSARGGSQSSRADTSCSSKDKVRNRHSSVERASRADTSCSSKDKDRGKHSSVEQASRADTSCSSKDKDRNRHSSVEQASRADTSCSSKDKVRNRHSSVEHASRADTSCSSKDKNGSRHPSVEQSSRADTSCSSKDKDRNRHSSVEQASRADTSCSSKDKNRSRHPSVEQSSRADTSCSSKGKDRSRHSSVESKHQNDENRGRHSSVESKHHNDENRGRHASGNSDSVHVSKNRGDESKGNSNCAVNNNKSRERKPFGKSSVPVTVPSTSVTVTGTTSASVMSTSATLASATLASATLASATLASATLASATLASATLASATLASATLAIVTSTSTTLASVTLDSVNLTSVTLASPSLTSVTSTSVTLVSTTSARVTLASSSLASLTSASATLASVTSASATSVSASISRSAVSTRPCFPNHIQSSILLQKQSGISNPTIPITNTFQVPSNEISGRLPFQPITGNVPSRSEPLPSNMVDTNSHLQWNDFLRVILKWNPCWFDEKEKMEMQTHRSIPPPPDIVKELCGQDKHTLFPLVERYQSFKEYSEKFMMPLLLYETWECCYKTWREKKSQRRLCNLKLMFMQQLPAEDKMLTYMLVGLISEKDRRMGNYANEGDLVRMNVYGDLRIDEKKTETTALNMPMLGSVDKVIFKDLSVERICKHFKEMAELRKQIVGECVSIKLLVKIRKRAFTPSISVIELQEVSSIINTGRQFQGLQYLPRSVLCQDILFPTSNMTYCDTAPALVPGLQNQYNESQSRAINTATKIACLRPEEPRICLLQGPPGTGKSHTIVGIIQQIVRKTGGHCRICLCAPSNAAVDELLKRIIRYNKTIDRCSSIRIIRLGKRNGIHPDVQSYCLDQLVLKNLEIAEREEQLKHLPPSLQGERTSLENKILAITKKLESTQDQFQRKKLNNDLKKFEREKQNLESKCVVLKQKPDPQKEKNVRREVLLKSHVIAGTLSSIGSRVLREGLIGQEGFQVVIIDEATQAIELETLIPLQYGVSKLILVGDPEQLPPTVISQVATDNKLNMSLFERLNSHFKFSGTGPSPVILLNTQYRMDPHIAHFPNNYIYENLIQNAECVMNRQTPLVPYLLFDVSEGREIFSQTSRSMSNPVEAIFTAELCQYIINKSKFMERHIGIIAPYAKQKSEIMQQLQNRGLSNIDVSTVDGFQGQEKHIIVMSCVRANVTGAVGFVGNRNRMNVSLTRAKYAMYLVGHFELLESSDEWKALIADARERQKIISVSKSSTGAAFQQILKT